MARCLTLDRKLSKGSWPGLLPEVTFYCNNSENSSTKFPAQLLMTGRLPVSPIDALIETLSLSVTDSHEHHLERLKERKDELNRIVRENDELSKVKRQSRYDKNARRAEIEPGDFILERNETRTDSLDVRYKGPFEVVARRGANLKIKRDRGSKWVHANRCKLYEGEGNDMNITIPGTISEESGVTEANIEPEEPAQSEGAAEVEVETDGTTENYGNTEATGITIEQRRYPKRDRKPKSYEDYIYLTKVGLNRGFRIRIDCH